MRSIPTPDPRYHLPRDVPHLSTGVKKKKKKRESIEHSNPSILKTSTPSRVALCFNGSVHVSERENEERLGATNFGVSDGGALVDDDAAV
jgi:hypothetical protein